MRISPFIASATVLSSSPGTGVTADAVVRGRPYTDAPRLRAILDRLTDVSDADGDDRAEAGDA